MPLSSLLSGNLVIAACLLFVGGLFTKTAWFAELLNLAFISETLFYDVQAMYLLPVIHWAWSREKERVRQLLQAKPLTIAGDGRCDSPGYSAKYGTYTCMDIASELVVDFNLVQVTQASSSVAMEKLGCQEVMKNMKKAGLDVKTMVTDRSPQVKALMKKTYPTVSHQFDVWHFIKNVCKRIRKAGKKKDCSLLTEWLPAISNHFWWSAATCEGNAELLREKWSSVLYHIVNRHSWAGAVLFKKCAHRTLTRAEKKKKKWLTVSSPAYKALEGIVEDKKILKDLKHLSGFWHTGFLEVYHNVMLKYCPKREHFSFEVMNARAQLTALDHNHNVGRKQAKRSDGQLRYTIVYPKQKNDWLARPVYEKKSYGYLQDMLNDCFRYTEGDL